jgi:hypothetical protein
MGLAVAQQDRTGRVILVAVGLLVLVAGGAHAVHAAVISRNWHFGNKFQPGPDMGRSTVLFSVHLLLLGMGALLAMRAHPLIRIGAVALGFVAWLGITAVGSTEELAWSGLAFWGAMGAATAWLAPIAVIRKYANG